VITGASFVKGRAKETKFSRLADREKNNNICQVPHKSDTLRQYDKLFSDAWTVISSFL
jgi:hypothetical protein